MFGVTFRLQFMFFFTLLLEFILCYLVFSFELCSTYTIIQYNYSNVLFPSSS